MRDIKQEELSKPIASLIETLAAKGTSVLIREDGIYGVAIAAVLVGQEYEKYADWQREQAWADVDKLRQAFSDLSEQEINELVDEAVQEVRRERHAARKAS